MPRLTRVHQKVFASNASNNGVFGSLQAGNPQTSNDVAVLQSLSAFENGWDDAIEQGDKLPPLEEFQGIQYGISYQQAYMLQEGIAEWDANTPYYKGGLVKTISGTSFKLYCSLADNNTNKAVTNTSYWKKVMDSDDLYAYDSAVVHLAGNETITGAKTFTNSINRKGSWTAGTPGSSNQTSYINFTDSTGTSYGSIGKFYGAGGTFRTEMTGKKTDGTGEISISIGYDASGNPRALAPTPDTLTNTTSTQIATTGWANTTGNNIVHLDSSETITGEKTFTGTFKTRMATTGYYSMYYYNDAITIGTAPSANTAIQFNMEDSVGGQNHRVGGWFIRYNTDGSTQSGLLAYKPDGTVQTNSGLGITYPSSGDPYGYAPNSDVAGSILTTSAINKAKNGYLKLGNGVIIQWGRNEVTASGGQTITLPTAFTNSNYKVVSAMESSDGYGQLGITSRTTTNFTFNPNWAGTYAWIAIGY